MNHSRRGLIIGAGAVSAALAGRASGAETVPPSPDLADSVTRSLRAYVEAGDKAAGGSGDTATGVWLEGALTDLGFTTSLQAVETPWFETLEATLKVGDRTLTIRPQAIVVATGSEGLSAPLALRTPEAPDTACRDAIVLVVLAHRRWSSARSAEIQNLVGSAFSDGAVAVVLVTTGPTQEAIALNATADTPLFDRPVAVAAPRDVPPILVDARAGLTARLTISGTGGRRAAFNVVGRLDRGVGRALVVSTPRSGWSICAGERGPGVAIWLALAAEAVRSIPLDLVFVATTGHEYENIGGISFIRSEAPRPDHTALWVHAGANAATRDWHETALGLLPLPSADPQRFLVASEPLVPMLSDVFNGQPGLERPYPATGGAQGELSHIIAAGYPKTFGVFGAHRFHHTASDDMRAIDADLVVKAAEGFIAATRRALA